MSGLPHLVTHDSDAGFLRAVRLLDKRAMREMDWAEPAGSPSHWGEAWVWSDLDPPPAYVPSSVFAGYATFTGYADDWSLLRIWLRPVSRRGGLLTAVWPTWQERYGDFSVVRPSEAMHKFLLRGGYAPEPTRAGMRPLHWRPLKPPVSASLANRPESPL
jgi:hypothetical protein